MESWYFCHFLFKHSRRSRPTGCVHKHMPVVDVHVDHYKTKESIVRRGRYYDGERTTGDEACLGTTTGCNALLLLRAIRKRRLIPTTPRSTNFFVLYWHCRPACFLWQLSAHSRTRGRLPFRVSLCFKNFSFSSSHFYSLRLLFFELLNSISANKRWVFCSSLWMAYDHQNLIIQHLSSSSTSVSHWLFHQYFHPLLPA